MYSLSVFLLKFVLLVFVSGAVLSAQEIGGNSCQDRAKETKLTPTADGLDFTSVSETVEGQKPEATPPGRIKFKPCGIHMGEAESNRADREERTPSFFLRLKNGTELTGVVKRFHENELIWEQPGISTPIPFDRKQVSELVLFDGNGDPHANTPSDTTFPDTVKLLNGDWLKGNLVSLDEKQAEFRPLGHRVVTIPREKLEWLYLGDKVAMDGVSGIRSLTGWTFREGASHRDWAFHNGALECRSNAMIGRNVDFLPDQIKLKLEVSSSTNRPNFDMWLFTEKGAQGSYVEGVCQLKMIPDTVTVQYFNGNIVNDHHAQLPQVVESGKPVTNFVYEIFVDREKQKLALFVNGKKIGDWVLTTDQWTKRIHYHSIGIQNIEATPSSVFKLLNLDISPWDGIVPDEVAASEGALPAAGAYWLSDVNKRSEEALISIDDKQVQLKSNDGAVTVPRTSTRFFRFSEPEKPTQVEGEMRLQLVSGELSIQKITIEDHTIVGSSDMWGTIKIPIHLVKHFQLLESTGQGESPIADGELSKIYFGADQVLELSKTQLTTTIEGVTAKTSEDAAAVILPWAEVKAVRLFESEKILDTNEYPSVLLLKNQGFLPCKILEFDGETVETGHPALGQMKWNQDEIQEILIDGQEFVESGVRSDLWLKQPTEFQLHPQLTQRDQAQATLRRIVASQMNPEQRSHPEKRKDDMLFDGSIRSNPVNDAKQAAVGRSFVDAPTRFLLKLTVASPDSDSSYGAALCFYLGKGGSISSLSFDSDNVTYQEDGNVDANGNQNNHVFFLRPDKPVNQADGLFHYDFYVDRLQGEITVKLNGSNLGVIRSKNLRQTPRQKGFAFDLQVSYEATQNMTYRDVSLRPWSGVLQDAEHMDKAKVMLVNGDTVEGVVKSLHEGAMMMETEIGPLTIATSRVLSYSPSGKKPQDPAVIRYRIRLMSGGVLPATALTFEPEHIILTCAYGRIVKVPMDEVREICPVSAPKTGAETDPNQN